MTPPTEPPRPAHVCSAPARPARPPLAPLLTQAGQMVAANFAVAVLIVALHGGPFGATLAYAEAIGLIIWMVAKSGRFLIPLDRHDGWPIGRRRLALMGVACAIGYASGTTIVDTIRGESSWSRSVREPSALLADLALTATFASIIAGWFYTRSRTEAHHAQVAAALHDATLARLVLLQSQLEPHMLFNTLANLRVLIATDPERAQAMLDRLIDFLRATLAASRRPEHPLKDEFARVADYLALMKVRMGDRLDAVLELPPELAALPVPPLLLQPLVENAIKHGLEPKRGPGALRVSAVRDGASLVLAVIDSGRGLEAAAADTGREPGSGFGLAQIRERLQTLHGDAARCTLAPRAGGGTHAEIRLPLAAASPAPDRPTSPTP